MAHLSPSVSGTDDIRARLAGNPDLPADAVVDLIVRDQERRWRRDERVLVESYLAAHPVLANPETRIDLIYAEILLRESFGERPTPDEYAFRFPDLTDRVRDLYQLHQTLSDALIRPELKDKPPLHTPQPVLRSIDLPGYDILEEIGRGGMGVVYKAHDRELGRTVAVKMLRSEAWTEETEARLRREAEALAHVPHPNIVQIYEVGTYKGQPYLVLEYVPGGTLADQLREKPLSFRKAAELVRTIAEAVHAVHLQGVVHRDLKPANVLMVDGGQSVVKVTDFGVAKRLDQMGLSVSGEMIGTPSYMAPEQAAGSKTVGPAIDIYALGSILYEGLTGRPPFQGDTALSVLLQVAHADPVAPRRLRPGIPRDLETICLKCLEKEPAQRYGSAQQLADDLGRYLNGQPVLARPLSVAGRSVKLVRRHPLPAGLLALVAVTLVAGLVGVLWQWRHAVWARGEAESAARSEADQRRRAERNLYHGRITQAALLWESGEAGQARNVLAACLPEAGAEDWRGWEWHYLNRQLHSELRVLWPTKSSQWVNGLTLCPSVPGRPSELAVAIGRSRLMASTQPTPGDGLAGFLDPTAADGLLRPGPDLPSSALAVAVQPRGTLVAWGTADGHIILGDRSTGRLVRTIALPNHPEVASLCFTSDGARLAAGGPLDRVWVLDPATGECLVERRFSNVTSPCLVVPHPNKSLLAVGSRVNGSLRLFDLSAQRVVAEFQNPDGGISAIGFSPDGRLFAAAGNRAVTLWNTATWSVVHRLFGHDGGANALAFHPRAGYLATGGRDRTVRLWLLATGQPGIVFRGAAAPVNSLAFGSRGEWLACGSQDGTVRVWDPTRDPRGLRKAPQREWFPPHQLNDVSFDSSPAGPIARVVQASGAVESWVAANGKRVSRVKIPLRPQPSRLDHFIRCTTFLGGGRLALINRDNPAEVAIYNADTGKLVNTLPPGDGPVRTLAADPTARWLAWASAVSKGKTLIQWWDLATQERAGETRLDAEDVRALAVEPAGKWLVVVTSHGQPADDSVTWAIDATGQQPPREIARGPLMLGGLAVHPDGRELAVAVGDSVHVYRAGTWELLQQFSCPPPTTGLAYSPDGRRLAAVNSDGVVTLADPTVGQVILQLHGLAQPRVNELAGAARVAFSPDGRWLLSTNWDDTLNFWDGSPTP